MKIVPAEIHRAAGPFCFPPHPPTPDVPRRPDVPRCSGVADRHTTAFSCL
ncbi:unnamed protein product [Ectocarpus sp. CCAP 1310/34]|nr:unnamed protein product [Ectocarpus sp. CCAP 1310/34]